MTIYVTGASVPVTNWYDQVLPWMRGLDTGLALSVIQDTLMDFCERSWVLNDFLPPMDVLVNQPTYAYAPPAGLQVTRRLSTWYAGNELSDKPPGDFPAIYGGNWTTKTGTPLFVTGLSPLAARLVPIPSVSLAAGLLMRVVFQPTVGASAVDASLWTQYNNIISWGARARLYNMKDKPWSDPKRADDEQEMYERGIDISRMQVQRGFGKARPRSRGAFF